MACVGTIYHLGRFIQDSKAFEASRAIREYAHYLGYHKGTAVELCNSISSVQIDGRYLTQIRNGLAHGDIPVWWRNPDTVAKEGCE